MKKIITGVLVAVLWLAAVTYFAVAGTRGVTSDKLTVLAVKEDVVYDYNQMPVFKQIAEDTGVDVFWTYNTSSQYENTTDPIATRGIDAIYHAGLSNLQLYRYGKNGRIVAIDDYLKDDKTMPNFYHILQSRPDIKEALKSPDGHIYSLPRVEEMGLKAYPNILFINKAWIEKLIDGGNLPKEVTKIDEETNIPTNVPIDKEDLVDGLDLTRNQFKAILQKFKELDLGGSGRTVPLTFVNGNWQGNVSDLVASFGVPENRDHKTIVDGKITFTIEDENWFNAVAELQSWVAGGLIPKAAFEQDQDTFLAKGHDGRYGSFYWWEKDTVLNEELRDDYIIVKPLIDDYTHQRYVGVSNELEIEKGECVILSTCEDVKSLLTYFDAFFEPDYSAQLNYGSTQSGAFLPDKSEDGKLIPNDYHGAGVSADDFRRKNAPYGVIYLTNKTTAEGENDSWEKYSTWDKYVEMESRAQTRLNWLEAYVIPYTFAGAEPIPNLNYTEAELNGLSAPEFTLGNDIKIWFTQSLIAPSAPTKESWQDFLNGCRASMETIKRINQDAYDRYIAAIKPIE